MRHDGLEVILVGRGWRGYNKYFLGRVDEDLVFDLKDVWELEMEERDKSRLIFFFSGLYDWVDHDDLI